MSKIQRLNRQQPRIETPQGLSDVPSELLGDKVLYATCNDNAVAWALWRITGEVLLNPEIGVTDITIVALVRGYIFGSLPDIEEALRLATNGEGAWYSIQTVEKIGAAGSEFLECQRQSIADMRAELEALRGTSRTSRVTMTHGIEISTEGVKKVPEFVHIHFDCGAVAVLTAEEFQQAIERGKSIK